MRAYVPTHLDNAALSHELNECVSWERDHMAYGLGRLALFDERRLYVPAGFASMFEYCVRELRFSEDAALKRIRAARAAREFPAIFPALSEGRLHLSAVLLLKPYLTRGNAEELLAAAADKTKRAIERLLAERFPRTELLEWVEAPAGAANDEQAAAADSEVAPGPLSDPARPVAPGPPRNSAPSPAPGPVRNRRVRDRLIPLAPERFGLQASVRQETHDLMCYARELQSHRAAPDFDELLNRAFKLYVRHLEKRRFGATDRPRSGPHRVTRYRTIPAHVRRAVWKRDQGQCTFVSESGQHCTARTALEFDHVLPLARGGQSTVENVRLLCSVHNQHAAERIFGAGFMAEKRQAARRATAERRARAGTASAGPMAEPVRVDGAAAAPTEAGSSAAAAARATDEMHAAEVQAATEARAAGEARALAEEHARDVTAALHELGLRGDRVRCAVEYCLTLPDATIEDRLRAALQFTAPKPRFQGRVGATPGERYSMPAPS